MSAPSNSSQQQAPSWPSLTYQTEDGVLLANKIAADLIAPIFRMGLENHALICKSALELCRDQDGLRKYESLKRAAKQKPENRSADFFTKLSGYTVNQLRNQSMRFGLEWNPAEAAKQSWGLKNLIPGQTTSAVESREYEDVISQEVLGAPIVDICIIQSGEPIPDGYFRIYKTPGNRKASLNSGNGGNSIYLCIKKDMTGQFAPVTNILVIFPDRGEYVPPGYHLVQRGKNAACNINVGTSAEHVYIAFKRDFLGNPISDLQPIFLDKGEEVPKNYNMIERTIFGAQANVNTGTGGSEIHLCYRQELMRLQCLLNDATIADQERLRLARVRAGSQDDNSSTNEESPSVASSSGSAPSSRVQSVNNHRRSRSRSPMRTRDSVGGPASRTPRLRPVSSFSGSERDTPADAEPTIDVAKNESTSDLQRTDEATDQDLEAALDSFADFYDETADAREAELVTLQRMQVVVDSFGNPAPEAKRKLLMALLVSIYTRRAEIGRNGVAALCHLLKDTDFFADDLANAPIPGSITMLDLAIETACDRFDFSPEADHVQILTFLRIVIKHSGAKLSGVSVQKLFRTINYLCNCYATKSDWIVNGHNMPCNDPSQDITPYRVLKQLVCDAVAQAETVEIAHYLPETMDFFDDESWVHDAPSQAYVDVRFIVEDIIDDIVDSVNTARICEATLQTLSKQAFSTSSVAFWQQINLSARKLFVEPALRSPFVTLCAICKQAWHNVRTNKAGEPIPRDLGSKLVALEAINEFCNSAGEKMRASKIMGYQIRRLVIPCLMFNISYALIDLKIFMKVLRILTALWNKWRRYLRIEFAILCDQFIFKTLQASVWQIRPIFQLQVIQEVIKWFEQPHLLIEMFVNYDMDRKFVSHWNTFSYLVRSLCMIGRRVSVVTNAWDWRPINQGSEDPSVRVAVTVRDVHLQALEEVGRMAKVVMDASGHAFLIIQDSNFRNRSLGAAGWVEDEETLLRKGGEHGSADGTGSGGGGEPPASTTGTASSAANPETTTASAASAASVATASGGGGESGVEMGQSIRHRRAAHQQSEKLIKEAIKIYTEKDSLKKAVKFLVSKDFMPDTPQEVANFLRVYKNHFDPAAIGDFLGEGGTTPEEEEYYSQIRFRYTRAVPFVETDVEPALRLYLTGCGFRLPGEAQKINRFVEVFVKAFWQDNSGTPYCPFAHPDTIHMLAYAIIMLNTDLHRANIDKKSKAKKMTKEAFVNNLRGIDQGKDIDREYLSKIYDSIQANPIELAFKTSTKDQSDDLIFMQKDTMNMADDLLAQRLKATRRASGLAGGLAGGIVNPRQSTAAAAAADLRMTEEKKFIREIGQNLRDSDDLLRSLAPFSYRFQITDVDMKMSLDLVSFMFETVWFHFHSIVESIFNATSTDVSAKFAALDILCYTLTSAVFLDMKNEKMAFAKLLLQFRKSCESIPHVLTQGRTIPDDSWYTDVEQVTPDTTMEIIAKLHKLIVHIKDTIQEAVNYEQTQQVAAKFEKKTKVLDVNTFFVRQGDLQKINRNGRSTLYKFFLFSDQLIYAHLGMKKEYVAHEQLSLLAMTVTDLENDPTYCSFHVQHPTKSFTVVAESPAAKIQWIREINQAIVNCKKREQASRDGPVGRRMSMYGRIELQQSQLLAQRENERKNNTSGMMLGSPDRNGRGRRTTSYRKAHSNGSVGAAGAAVDAAPPLTVEGLAASARRHGTMASSRRSATDGGDGGEDDEGEAVFSDDDDDGDDDRRRGGGGGADGDYDDDDDLDEVTSTVPFALSPPVSSSSRKRFTFDEDHGPSGGSGGSGGGARAAVPQSPPTLNTPLSLTTTGGALGNGFDFDGGNESGAASQSRTRAGEDFDELSPVGQAVGGFDSGGLGGLGGGNTPVTGVSAASSSTNLAGLSSSTTATATATTTATAATPSTLPTAEERAQRQAERLQQLTTLLVDIDDKALDALFNAAASFWKTTSAGRAGSSTPAGGASSASLAAAATAAAAAAASPTATSPTSNCSGGSSGSSGDRMIALQKAAKLGPAWPALAVAIAATNAVGTDSNTNAAASAASAASSSAPTAPAAAAATGLEGNTATAVALFSVTEAQWDAWCQLGDGAQVAVDAKKAFLVEVLSAASYWKYEQFL